MKYLIALCTAMLVFGACAKEPSAAENLPSEVNLGESQTYLNGKLESNYKSYVLYVEADKTMNYIFYDSIELKINSVGFSWLPLTTGDFELHDERILFVKALTSFNQIISEDLEGYSYKLIDEEEGFLKVEALDTVQHTVKGRFQAKFKRTSKNGNGNLGLPKILLFQGVFHEEYKVI
jgi:hypothetical protein